jgi:DeoR family transcriptional regulator, fructose operon transcriptional repressor
MSPVRYRDAPARRAALLERLTSRGYVSSVEAAEDLGVSEMTIRRDLDRLTGDGLAQRVAGGASLPRHDAPSFSARRESAGSQKHDIARRAAMLLQNCATVALDAGTTVAALADLLPRHLTVVTHSVPLLTACTAAGDLGVMSLGGWYEPDTRSFTGPHARAALEASAVDVAVLSATALDGRGLYCSSPLDADVKQCMVAAAETVVVLADHSKLGRRAPIRFASLDTVDVVVTDAEATTEQLTPLRAVVESVLVADREGARATVSPEAIRSRTSRRT